MQAMQQLVSTLQEQAQLEHAITPEEHARLQAAHDGLHVQVMSFQDESQLLREELETATEQRQVNDMHVCHE